MLVTVFWGVMTGAVAGILLMAGGLAALQTLCILAAFPFMFVMIGAAVGLMKELRNEPDPPPHPGRRKTAVEAAVDARVDARVEAAVGATVEAAVDAAVEARVIAADGADPFTPANGTPIVTPTPTPRA